MSSNSSPHIDILLIVPIPPPLGGVAVHGARLADNLARSGYRISVLDYLGEDGWNKPDYVISLPKGVFKRILCALSILFMLNKDTIVHFHVAAFGNFKKVAPILFSVFWFQKKLVTIHAGYIEDKLNSVFDILLVRWMMGRFDQVIVVNRHQAEFVARMGVCSNRINLIPGFIPDTPSDECVLPEYESMRLRRKIVLLSGFIQPLYNYDVMIDCIDEMDSDEYGFVFAFYGEIDADYERHIMLRLFDRDNVLVYRDLSPDVFLYIMKNIDIYVRATTSDGDAMAVREALFFNKRVFATDCVDRPQECSLFSAYDYKTLIKLFKFQSEVHIHKDIISNETQSNFDKVREVYRKLQDERAG